MTDYVGVKSPHKGPATNELALQQRLVSNGTQSSARATSGHGALRDDVDNECSITISMPPGTSFANHVKKSMRTTTLSAHGQSADEASERPSAQLYRGSEHGNSHSIMQEKKRTVPTPAVNLKGREPTVPRFFLSYPFRRNSFFAKRLLRIACVLAAVMAGGVGVYYFYKPKDLRLDPHDDRYGFVLDEPARVYTFQANACEIMVGYSALVYHAFPAVLIIALPASGLRVFEPFKREPIVDPDGNRNKIKRTLVFQACELTSVMVLMFSVWLVLYSLKMFMGNGTFHCDLYQVHAYAAVAFLCFLGIFAEIVAFARFREHIKMQLGAFQECDQTGDIRHHVVDANAAELMTKEKKIAAAMRKNLYKATRLGDVREMEKILEDASSRLKGFPEKYYPDAKIYFRFFGMSQKNPMHVAAHTGNIKALELLLSYGFRVNSLDKFSRVRFSTGDLFWFFAAFFVSKPVVLEEDQAVSIFKTTVVTPLHCAVATGQLEAVKWLVENGAEVATVAKSSIRSERISPLFLAEHPDVVRYLLEQGANHLEIPDPGHMNTVTVLQLAYLRGNYAVAQELEEWGGDVALTPFHAAAALNDVAAVRKFIRKKTDVHCLGEHGYIGMNRRTPLHWAAVNGACDVVELLLEANADPNFQDTRGRTPLHWAARLNRLEVVQLLLKKGADPNIADVDFMTPIICAAQAEDVSRELFSALVNAGSDINYQLLSNGDTALHIAIRFGHEETALSILACGGNVMKMNAEQLRPLDCTTSTKLQFVIKQAAGHRDVMISYTHSHTEFAKKLRKSLEDANITTWLDLMDPSGIGGGSVWREEIARGITNASLVICILTEDYPRSEWCLKELALAKQVGTPILAVSTDSVRIGDELQVYLYTRQIIPFEPAIIERRDENPRQVEYGYDEAKYSTQFRLLLDGVRDEIEKRRNEQILKNAKKKNKGVTDMSIVAASGFSQIVNGWDTSAEPRQFVFISHGDFHADFVSKLYQELTDVGVICFIDRNNGSTGFDARIHAAREAILTCSAFIVILSPRTCKSELVRDQLAYAEDKGRPIYPILLNEIDVGLDKKYSLSRMDLYHFTTDGLGFRATFDSLVSGLRQHYTMDGATILRESGSSSFVSFTYSGEPTSDTVGFGGHGGVSTYTSVASEVAILEEETPRTERSAGEKHESVRNFESLSEEGLPHFDPSSDTHLRM